MELMLNVVKKNKTLSNIYPTIQICDKEITVTSFQVEGGGRDFSPSFTVYFFEGFPYRHFIIFLKLKQPIFNRDFFIFGRSNKYINTQIYLSS